MQFDGPNLEPTAKKVPPIQVLKFKCKTRYSARQPTDIAAKWLPVNSVTSLGAQCGRPVVLGT